MEATPQKRRHSRRSALKTIITGTGVAAGFTALPGKWVKPLVDVVLVPAHAETSPCFSLLTMDDIRLDCSMPSMVETIEIYIDDLDETRCPKLLIERYPGDYNGDGPPHPFWIELGVGEILFMGFPGGSSEQIWHSCNRPRDYSNEYVNGFRSLSGVGWSFKAQMTLGSEPIPYLELTNIRFIRND